MPVRKIRGRSRRQNFLLGTLHPEREIRHLAEYLIARGYRTHHVAWRDPDQSLSLRLVVDFEWQYHMRIYSDGEVRGHYELTPESYPWKHLKKVNMEDRREEFLRHLENWIIPA